MSTKTQMIGARITRRDLADLAGEMNQVLVIHPPINGQADRSQLMRRIMECARRIDRSHELSEAAWGTLIRIGAARPGQQAQSRRRR